MSAYAAAPEEALADRDAWHGFCTYIERVCAMQAAEHGFTEVLTLTFPAARPLGQSVTRHIRDLPSWLPVPKTRDDYALTSPPRISSCS